MAREAPEMTLDYLDKNKVNWWYTSPPSSGGVISVFLCDGRMYTVSDGDMRDRDSCGITECSAEEWAMNRADDPITTWLRQNGHIK